MSRRRTFERVCAPIYIGFSSPDMAVARSEELCVGVIVDYAGNGSVIGIELHKGVIERFVTTGLSSQTVPSAKAVYRRRDECVVDDPGRESNLRRVAELVDDEEFESPDRDKTWRNGYGVSHIELVFLVRMTVKMVVGRLAAGDDPEDVLWTVNQLFQHTQSALIDGNYRGPIISRDFHHERVKELESKVEERDATIAELNEDCKLLKEKNAALRAACAPSKLKKIDRKYSSWAA